MNLQHILLVIYFEKKNNFVTQWKFLKEYTAFAGSILDNVRAKASKHLTTNPNKLSARWNRI